MWLQNPPFPPETFGNLLLLYCKPQHAFYDLAADVMAENQHLVAKHLNKDLYDYLDAAILRQTSPEVRGPSPTRILVHMQNETRHIFPQVTAESRLRCWRNVLCLHRTLDKEKHRNVSYLTVWDKQMLHIAGGVQKIRRTGKPARRGAAAADQATPGRAHCPRQ